MTNIPQKMLKKMIKTTNEGNGKPGAKFSEVKFKNKDGEAISSAKYVRIGANTDVQAIFDLLKMELGVPKYIVSVIGGAKKFCLEKTLKDELASNLQAVAKLAGVWVLTGGTNTGVMQYVGETLQGVTNFLIGISSWGTIEKNLNNEKLEYTVDCGLSCDGAILDTDHKYHVLIDDSTASFQAEIPFRSRFEKHFIKNEIPIVDLVIEGGYWTLATIHEQLTSVPPVVPVIVVKGSGRMADLISHVLHNDEHVQISHFLPEVADDDEKGSQTHQMLCDVVNFKNHISIFEVTDKNGLDDIIFRSLSNQVRK